VGKGKLDRVESYSRNLTCAIHRSVEYFLHQYEAAILLPPVFC